jgi:hypothetical protein
MSVEPPQIGDGEVDEKIKEWWQWDKVLHSVSARLQFIRCCIMCSLGFYTVQCNGFVPMFWGSMLPLFS